MFNLNLPSVNQHNLFTRLNNYTDTGINTNTQTDTSTSININTDINIFKNLNSLDEHERNIFVNKTLSDNQKNNIILKYELLNYCPNKKKYDLCNFKKLVKYIFDRYTYKAGGFNFDTSEWNEHIIKNKNKNTRKINISKIAFIYKNTLHNDYINDLETREYLVNMFNIFNKLSSNFSIKLKIEFKNRDNMNYVFFIFVMN